ncbi:MAG TPA: hypothetical protein VL426_01260 [Candidatus Binatia bacterium]|nr:hypothetical protein [Candidatus Binatia bacterium]
MPHVAIIGAGNLGAALADILKDVADVRSWDKDPAKSPPGATLEGSLKDASHAFLCLPSWTLTKALADVTPFLSPGAVIVGMSKGIETDKGRTVDELLAETAGGRPWAIMSGPMLAAELSAGMTGGAVIASPDEAARESTLDLFKKGRLAVEPSSDARGVALCGVLKNVYAVGLGIGAALGWSDNLRGMYVSLAVREAVLILTSLGGQGATVLGPAGVADLVATGFSPHSRNRRFGEEIVKNGSCPLESEGCASLPPLMARLGDVRSEAKALEAVHRVVIGREKAAEVFGGLWGGRDQ